MADDKEHPVHEQGSSGTLHQLVRAQRGAQEVKVVTENLRSEDYYVLSSNIRLVKKSNDWPEINLLDILTGHSDHYVMYVVVKIEGVQTKCQTNAQLGQTQNANLV